MSIHSIDDARRSTLDEPVKTQNPDSFVERSSSRRANLEE
jgi:hypothetical protein